METTLRSQMGPDDTLVLQFSVFNDPGIELVRYVKWKMVVFYQIGLKLTKICVVVTDIPSNIDLLEFKVIGIDDKNNEFEIAVYWGRWIKTNRELAKSLQVKLMKKYRS